MKQIKVKEIKQAINIICLLLGEYVVNNAKVSCERLRKIDFKDGNVVSYIFKLEKFNESYVVDFFVFKKYTEIIVYAFGMQHSIIVKDFPIHGFLNMEIIDCFFNAMTEQENREAVGFILDAKEDSVQECV